ncbi:hypothetical protein QBC34DRAFT_305295 [Podospora aff. communis PSN243]|uniref:Uncharacterized protein n=1 Tax=Podospora aff. communis PSN243 TaxID=3040156 RepID=A0AAV9GDS5_9PEZI|nr:hypothetical protein QBC34DRAFT_305295 [Podospora aff. communis PSN243]
MPSKYFPLSDDSPRESDEDARSLLGSKNVSKRQPWYPTLRTSLLATVALVLYSLGISWVTKIVVQGPHHRQPPEPASSFPHPDEKEYVITTTGQPGNTWVHNLVYGKPSPEVDEAWFDLLKPFNTRVPAERYEASMGNRSSVRISDGSGDYYVTLTMYHELHCLMRFRWFLHPGYYANKTWEEQANDAGLMGHYRHCVWSLLESVMCNGDTSMRTFHWDSMKPAPKPDSPAERKCVNWDWLYKWTLDRSFLLQDRKLSHPTYGLLDEKLMPVHPKL